LSLFACFSCSDEDPDELQDLEDDANLTIEELRAKYNVGGAGHEEDEEEEIPEAEDDEEVPAGMSFF
jgi:hypothetical protein